MSSVYRILVDSSKRQTGHMFDFSVDVSRITTSMDFSSQSWMCAVEWCDIVRYSEGLAADYTSVDLHSRGLLLTCPSLQQDNTFKSWSTCSGSTLCMLKSYMMYGIFDMSADQPYVSRKTLGCYIQGDRLNQSGALELEMLAQYDDDVVFLCL